MEWWLVLLLIFGSLIAIMSTGLPVAFSFTIINIVAVYLLWGEQAGLSQLIGNIYVSVATFTLLPVPMFILLGEVMFQSGMGMSMVDALDKWLGNFPGRLALLAVGSATLFSTTSGSSMATTAMLGSMLVPEMEKRGYKKLMSIGPIIGSGGLAMLIPPSALAVILASVAQISVGGLLVACVIPGLVIAILYVSYIIGRCYFQPSIAPTYKHTFVPRSQKVKATFKNVLPLGSIIFLVLGVIFLGIATPTEAAAMGAAGCFILAACYRRLNWQMVKVSIGGTIEITVMTFIIITGATTFSQVLAFSGASKGLAEFVAWLPLTPIMLLISMQIVVLIMGCFMDSVSIMLICLPIYMPLILTLGFDPIWFGVLMLINIEMGLTTPPLGLLLFVMKGVTPTDTTMGDIIRAGLPFLICDAITMGLLMAFPKLALWLPTLMRG